MLLRSRIKGMPNTKQVPHIIALPGGPHWHHSISAPSLHFHRVIDFTTFVEWLNKSKALECLKCMSCFPMHLVKYRVDFAKSGPRSLWCVSQMERSLKRPVWMRSNKLRTQHSQMLNLRYLLEFWASKILSDRSFVWVGLHAIEVSSS